MAGQNPNPQFLQLLTSLRSGDNPTRSAAEKAYEEALKADPRTALFGLLSCMDPTAAANGNDEVTRLQAATLLRRAAVQVGPTPTAWSKAGPEFQTQARSHLLQILASEPAQSVKKLLVAVIAAIAINSEENRWNDLVAHVFQLAASSDNVALKDSAMRLLSELLGTTYTSDVVARRQELGQLVQVGLNSQPLQPAALALVAEMVSSLEDDMVQAMQPALPLIEAALQHLASSELKLFEEALQNFVICAGEKPTFFKPRYSEWAEMMLRYASAKGTLPDGLRSLALEFISSLMEGKTKGLLKAIPSLPENALRMAFVFLSEVEDAGSSWEEVDEDEEEDDDDSLHGTGEAKVFFFVKKMGFDATKTALEGLLQQYGTGSRWQERLAACMAIRAAGEFVTSDASIDGMTTLLLTLAQDAHCRVRHAALFALGQMCHDLDASFPERWHARMVPVLVQAARDPVSRVSAKAISSLEALIGELDEQALSEHASTMLSALLDRLTASTHSGVLVTSMEAIGALAVGLEGSFKEYYEQLMRLLLAFVSKPSGGSSAESRLRGKAFECISLLGFAVGKQTFAPAARETMSAMLAAGKTSADEFQTDCIREAMERLCKILGTDFAPFLPALMPGILEGLRLDHVLKQVSEEELDADANNTTENDDDMVLPTEDGLVRVNTGKMTEMLSVVQLLNVFIREVGANFYDYARPVGEALARILGCADSLLTVASQVRDAIYPCWADLVLAVSKAVPKHGQAAQQLVGTLVCQFVDKVGADLCKAEDPEDLVPMATGISSVVNAGENCLDGAQVQKISSLALEEIMKSLQREAALEEADRQHQALGSAGDMPQLDDDDDDDEAIDIEGMGDMEETDEKEARVALCSIFGACFKASPEAFVAQSLPTLQPLMQQWLSKPGPCRALGLHLACDLLEHLGDRAAGAWPMFMEQVLEALQSKDAEERNTAAYAIVLAAQVPQFGSAYGSRAYHAVGSSLQNFKAKKTDLDGRRAADNAAAALCQLCLSQPEASPDLARSWEALLERLPLKTDLEESVKVNRKLFAEAVKPNGKMDNALVAKVLGYLTEVYGRSEHCDEELQRDISIAFASLPQGTVESLMAQFSTKQQKKVKSIVEDGRARGAGQA